MVSMGSEGWKLLGPSSHRNPSLSTVIMFPPTLSLASVTNTLGTWSWCLVASAWAMQSPLIPAPTMTQSSNDSPPSEPTSFTGGVTVDTEQRDLHRLVLPLPLMRRLMDRFREFRKVGNEETALFAAGNRVWLPLQVKWWSSVKDVILQREKERVVTVYFSSLRFWFCWMMTDPQLSSSLRESFISLLLLIPVLPNPSALFCLHVLSSSFIFTILFCFFFIFIYFLKPFYIYSTQLQLKSIAIKKHKNTTQWLFAKHMFKIKLFILI